MHYSFPVNIMLLAATFILPGPLTILSFYKKSLSLGTFLFFSLLGSIIIISWIGLILAQLAIFSALMLGWILLSYSLILLVIRKPWLRISLVQFPKISPLRMIPVIALFMLISIIYMRPHEYITGHWDPGTYLNTGFNLANSGSLLIHDKLLSRMPTKDQAVFAPSREDLTRTPGFYMKDPHAGQMIPQFYHTYPVWLALFFQYFGAKGALMLNPLFALCSIWTLFLLLKNLFNTKTAYMGLIIFSFNIVQIWNARFATSEVLAQYFILSGIYILYEAKKDHQTLLLTILSSGSFAMAILTRTTSILIIPLLALYLLTKDWCRMRKKDWIFLIPISIGIFHLALQSLYFTKAYVKTMPHFFSGSEEKNALYSYLSIVLITVICSLFRKRIQPILTKEKVLIFIRSASVVIIFGLALYGYFIRPHMGQNVELGNMIHLSWFLSPLGMALAITGFCLWIYKDFHKDDFLLLLICLVVTVFFIYKKRTYSSYPWALKRYTTIVIPAYAIYTAYLINHLWARLSGLKKVLPVILMISIILIPVVHGKNFIFPTDQKGISLFVENLHNRMDPKGIFLFDRDWIALPLQTIYGHRTLLIPYSYPKYKQSEEIFRKWMNNGEKIYYISDLGQPWSPTFYFNKIDSLHLKTEYLEPAYASYPDRMKKINTNFAIYQLEPILDTNKQYKPIDIYNIGKNPIGLVSGFDKARRFVDESRMFSWTSENAEIRLEDIPNEPVYKVRIKLKSPRPSEVPQAALRISVNGKKVKTFSIPKNNRFKTITFSLDSDQLKHHKLETIGLHTNTFNPKELGLSGDNRNLGVMVESITLQAGTKAPLQIRIGHKTQVQLKGFYSAEIIPNQYIWGRWTYARSEMIIPWPQHTGTVRLTLRLSGDRPPNEPEARVKISLNRKDLVEDFRIGRKFDEYTFIVKPDFFDETPDARITLSIQSNTWNPHQHKISGFPSRLGLLLDWAKIEAE